MGAHPRAILGSRDIHAGDREQALDGNPSPRHPWSKRERRSKGHICRGQGGNQGAPDEASTTPDTRSGAYRERLAGRTEGLHSEAELTIKEGHAALAALPDV